MKIIQRRLPHFYEVGTPTFVTFRLNGSLPPKRWFPEKLDSGKQFVAMDRILDEARTGPTFLRNSDVARCVEEALDRLSHPGEKPAAMKLHAWVIMPNHVHLLITPHESVSKLMLQLKGGSARMANQVLGRTGTFWQRESYDRLVRHQDEFDRVRRYIEMNPVKAGLAMEPELYRWSSAYRRHQVVAVEARKKAVG